METPIHCLNISNRKKILREYREKPSEVLETDDEENRRLRKKIENFYRNFLESSGMDGYVVGISGGVDSAVVAKLLVESVGAEKIHGMILPAEHTSERDIEDGMELAERLGISTNDPAEFRNRIEGIVDSLEELGEMSESKQRLKRGNILSRCRMIVIRDVAKARNSLVAGTTNASEKLLGYTTLAGDGKGGVDCEGIYELFKTSVYSLGEMLELPESILEKEPSGDLWKGQKDSEELGHGYEFLDRVLAGYCIGLKPEKIAEIIETDTGEVRKIIRKVRNSCHKHLPVASPSF